MATILKFRRFTTSDHTNFIGSDGELTIDTTKKTIRVHDGVTAGGSILATESHVQSQLDYVQLSYDTTQVSEGKIATALTTAEDYTDTRETAIRSTLTTSLQSYDTSLEVDGKISTAFTVLNDYDTSLEVDGKISTAINNLVDGAPAALNTLNELAAAVNDDASYAATITTALGTKAPLASPALTGTPTAPTATLSTNDTQIANTAFVQSLIAQQLQAMFPTGIITIWKGSAATIPSGYVLCNGLNGTPDLTDKFIVGAGNSYSPGDNGGTLETTLTTSNMPAHSHTGTTDANGGHRHAVANGDTVNSTTTNPLTTSNYLGKTGSMASTSSNYILGGTTTEPTQGLTSAEPDHTHTFTTSTEGTGEAFDNRPPYYALCYIMKVWA